MKKISPKIRANYLKLIRISFLIVKNVDKCNNRENDDIDNDVVGDRDDDDDDDDVIRLLAAL